MSIWTQQDLTFKIAERLEQCMDVRYKDTDIMVNAYDIESTLSSIIESLGMKLIIVEKQNFDSSLGDPFEL